MGNVYEALRRAESEQPGTSPLEQPWNGGDVPDLVPFPVSDLNQAAQSCPEGEIDPHLVSLLDCQGQAAEQFRLLSVRLRDLRHQNSLKKILVTSSAAGEGKSVVASNLAVSLALDGEQKVLLLGGDLGSLALNRLLGCNGLRGLTEYLQDEPLTHCVYRVRSLALWFMPAGSTSSPKVVQCLQSGRLKELLERLCSSFDWIVIDSPPLLPLADANIWARMADGTLLVIREGKTPRKPLGRALETLGNVPLLGVVMNECNHQKNGRHKSLTTRA